jgi:hypothetical protein
MGSEGHAARAAREALPGRQPPPHPCAAASTPMPRGPVFKEDLCADMNGFCVCMRSFAASLRCRRAQTDWGHARACTAICRALAVERQLCGTESHDR